MKEEKLFTPYSRAMNCRQLIWSVVKGADGPVAVMDIIRDHKESGFKKMEFYKAARALVIHGILMREDISWGVVVRGKERTRCRCAVRMVEPFTNASRKW